MLLLYFLSKFALKTREFLLQVMTLFYIAAAVYPSLVGKKGIPTFQFIYFFSSFWGQFGPNCTTFLLAGKCDRQLVLSSGGQVISCHVVARLLVEA